LRAMAAIAQKDGEVDVDEARVLRDIIDKLTDAELTPEMQTTIAGLRATLPSPA
jgi:tellurite resistance protein